MTNPEDLRKEFERSHRRFRRIVVLVALAGLAVLIPTARPAWQTLKNWRASQFLKQAEDLLADQQVALAFERARAAIQLVPQRPDAMRLNARILASIGSESSLLIWKRLVETGQASADDLETFLETSLGFDRTDLAESLLQPLTNLPNPSDRSHRLLALYRLQTGTPLLALSPARAAYEQAPSNPTNALLLATILTANAGPDAKREARRILWTLAESDSRQNLEALFRLIQPALGERSDRERVAEILASRSDRSAAEEVLLTETRILLNPADAAALAADALARMPRENWEHLTFLTEALVRLGRYEEVLRMTASGKSFANGRLFQARYEALLALGKPDEAYRHLLHTEAPLPPFDLELARVRGAQEAGDIKGRDAHLRSLLDIAADHPVRIRKVAELAESSTSSGATRVATEAWTRLAARSESKSGDPYRRLQRLADRQGDTWTARDFARKAARTLTNDLSLRLEIARYDLLLEDDLEHALRVAEEIANIRTNDLAARTVVALGHLRLGHPENARSLLDRLVLPESPPADDLAIVVAALGSNGLEARARDLAHQIPMNSLRPEERDLIRPWVVPAPLGAEIPERPRP